MQTAGVEKDNSGSLILHQQLRVARLMTPLPLSRCILNDVIGVGSEVRRRMALIVFRSM